MAEPAVATLPLKVSTDPRHPLLQRLAAGYLEILILQKSQTFAALWPEPGDLLTRATPVRDLLIEHVREAFQAAGPLARGAVLAAMDEAAELLPTCVDELPKPRSWQGADPATYDYRQFGEVLLTLLQGNALRLENVVDLGWHRVRRVPYPRQ